MGERYLGLRPDQLGPTRTELQALLRRHQVGLIAAMFGVRPHHVSTWNHIFGLTPATIRTNAAIREAIRDGAQG